MRTLVTGGAGFIGSHLVRDLLEEGRDVAVLDSLESQVHGPDVLEDLRAGVRFHHGDVGDASVLVAALEGVDEIVHLGALVGVGQSMYEIERYVRRNTLSTAAFLEAVVAMPQRPRRLVVASSMSIYGEGQYICGTHGRVAPVPRPEAQLLARGWECLCPLCGEELKPTGTDEDKPLIPTSVYAITKRDHEELCLVIGRAYGIPTVALRFFNVYGPGQALSNPYTGVAAIFGSRLLNGRAPIVFEDGEQSRDFIHVSDIVEGIVLALSSDDAADHAINLGTGRPTTINQMAEAIAAGLGSEIEPERVEQYRAGDIRHCYADVTLAERLLGFHAAVDLKVGMADLIDWVKAQEAVDHVDEATGELVARGLAR